MKVVGLVSSYREGRLTLGCIASLVRVGLDDLLVSEGPAGEIPEGIEAAPPSEFPPELAVNHGRWRTDARKRDAMLREAKRRYQPLTLAGEQEPLWGVWLDGDEILHGAEFIRDRLQGVLWEDAERGGPPRLSAPLWVKEPDGSLGVTSGRLVRLDLIRSYQVSVSVVQDVAGEEQGLGNVTTDARLWLELWMQATETGRLVAWPPGPGDSCIVHRSNLRHPARRGLRMHRQEAEELARRPRP